MKMYKIIGVLAFVAVAVGLVFFSAGCAVKKNPPFGAAEIVSTPPGADVVNMLDNSMLGTTPFKYVKETEDGEAHYITVKVAKPGYEEKTVSFFLSPKYEDEETAMENPQSVEVNLMQK